MNFCGDSIIHHKATSDDNNKNIEGANSRIYGSSGGSFKGGLSTICSPRVGAYSGAAFSRGANSRIYGITCIGHLQQSQNRSLQKCS